MSANGRNGGQTGPGSLRAGDLRCEYLVNPLAVQTQRPRLSWRLEAVCADSPRSAPRPRGLRQRAYRILVASSPALLRANQADLWDSGRVESDTSLHVPYAGRPLRSRHRCFWTVRVWDQEDQACEPASPAEFSVGLLGPRDWQGRWIGIGQDIQHPVPLLRREFTLDGRVKRAVLYATALGVYEMRCNGKRVGDAVLAPEWTSYAKRVQYQAYDITKLLRPGANALGALLGDGWYAGRLGLAHIARDCHWRGIYGRRTALRAQLHVELTDGSEAVVGTDGDWRFTLDGAILSSDLLDGEHYDARREMDGWDAPGFDDSGWAGAIPMRPRCGALVAQPNEPMRVLADLTPVSVREPKKGVYVLDLGQEIAGWCRLRLRGRRGQVIRLRHCERVGDDGMPYVDNLRIAPNLDTYICRGGGVETFEPRFTYHGFQYVEITGLDRAPRVEDVTGRAFWSACRPTGSIECSDPLLNRLASNIVWTQRDNMPGIPTDCPQRDERCGWTGDIQVFAQTGIYNMDLAAFLTKWLRDLSDDQAEDGRFPDFAPHPFEPHARFSGAPAWGDAGTIVPWRIYQNYADTSVLSEAYEPARRWVDHITRHNPDGLWVKERRHDYGDWLNADTFKFDRFPRGLARVPGEVLATVFYWQSTDILARMAEQLGNAEHAAHYGGLASRIRRAFHDAFVDSDVRIQGDTQAGYALALGSGILDASLHARAFDHMVRMFEPFDGHLSTGFITTVHAMNMLTRFGRSEQAYELTMRRTFPSWGYTIEQGGTTIWERWDGYVAGKGFQDPGMNSFCHYAIGAVGEWMYRTMLGLHPDEANPGWKHFTIAPVPGGGLSWVQGRYESIRGPIDVAWRVRGGRLSLNVSVPPNTTATIHVPTSDPASVREGGRAADRLPHLTPLPSTTAHPAAVFRVGSGEYAFTAAVR